MTMEIDKNRIATSYSFIARGESASPRSVLDAYGRWAVLRGAIADMETNTPDDELRALMTAEADTVRQMAALQPRTFDELAAKLDAFLAVVDEAQVSRDLRLLAHALAVDVRAWAATA
jgi:hypothetical protein